MKDYNKVIFDMAKSNGVGRLIVGPNVIPVKVTDIKHEHTIDSQETEFKCLAVDSTAAYTDTDSMYPAINSLYGMFSGRFSGKSYEEYQMMKDQLRKGCKLMPVGANGSWAAVYTDGTDVKVSVKNGSYIKSGSKPWGCGVPKIDKVMFKDPATIVFWKDGSKTVVKTQNGEPYDPEKGLAMAISKKALGNNREYYHVFLKHLKKYNKDKK